MEFSVDIEELLSSKPSKEVIFNSVTISDSFWKNSCKQQIDLEKKQQTERNKLKPNYELYNLKFNI